MRLAELLQGLRMMRFKDVYGGTRRDAVADRPGGAVEQPLNIPQ